MTINEAAESIVFFCEKNHDYLEKVNYVQNKLKEIIETRIRDTECQPDNRQNGMSSVERDSQEVISRTLSPFNPEFSQFSQREDRIEEL